MAITLPGGFNITNIEPVDARFTVADETARLGFSAANIYEGLIVYQQDTDALYVLTNTGSFSSNAGWSELGSSASTTALSSSIASRVSDLEVFSSSLDNTFTTEAELNASSSALSASFSLADNTLSSSLATALTTEYTAADTAISTSLAASITVNDGRLDTLEGKTLISSSNQIASDISGSFTTVSASLASRITANSGSSWNNLTDVPQDIVSSSIQLGSDISGSFTSTSASIAVDITDKDTRLNTLEGKTLVSSSIQLASDISGSFTSLSGSFADRITANSGSDWSNLTNVPQDIVSSSLQLGSDISGSFTSTSSSIATDIAALKVDSGSFSTRVTSLEAFSSSLNNDFATDAELNASSSALTTAYTEADNVLSSSLATALTTEYTAADTSLSSSIAADLTTTNTNVDTISASIATDITNLDTRATFATASILANETNIATNLTKINVATSSINVNETAIAALNAKTLVSSSNQIASDISGSFTNTSASIASGRLKNTTDTLTGDLTVTGTITAQEFFIEYVTSSRIEVSGSTKFGDTSDDTHSFTGSLRVSGSITGHSFAGDGSALTNVAASSVNYNNVTNKPTLVSSSIQIGSDISGSFTSTSASIATDLTTTNNNVDTISGSLAGRVTAVEDFSASLDATFATDTELNASSSALTTAYTEADTTLSSSLATALTTEYTAADNTLSASIATDITTTNSNLDTVSGSLAGRVTAVEDFSSSLDNTFASEAELNASSSALTTAYTEADENLSSSLATALTNEYTAADTTLSSSIALDLSSNYLRNTTDTITGDLTVTGKVTAQEFHTELVSSSIVYKSGSTKFGDTSDDTHDFTGSLNVSGSVTAHSFTGDGSNLTNITATSINVAGILSSSIQIGSDISGSFTSTSASIATDLTTTNTNLDNVSSSLATRTTALEDFSSSLNNDFATDAELNASSSALTVAYTDADTAISTSLATAITNNLNKITVATASIDVNETAIAVLNAKTLLSSSNQIASDISGSVTSLSASIATRFDGLTSDYNELQNVPVGILSSSNQIASDISGSFTSTSASIATDIATNDSRLDTLESKNLVSSSIQLASDISGSFTSTSASLAAAIAGISTDFADIENKPALVSSSIQLASDISGSFTATSASIATDLTTTNTNLNTVSSSLAGRTTALESFSSSLDNTYATDAELTATSSSIAVDITKIIDGNTLVASASYAVSSSVTNIISENVTEIVVSIKNVSGGTLAAGTPVHTTGVSGGKFEVIAADAATSAMPAIGLLQTSVSNNNNGDVVIGGTLSAVNTLGFTAGENIYVAAGGGLTGTKPTSSGNKIQNIGIVGQVNANGDIIVLGAGRTNDTPNLGHGEIFFGNGTTQNVNFSDTITGSAAYTGLDTRIGLNVVTASAAANVITFEKENGSTFQVSIAQSGSVESASYALNATTAATASYVGWANVANIPSDIVSSSLQLGSDISGSFTSLSASLAERITANSGSDWNSLTNKPQDIVSSSLQLASDISGSFTLTSASIADERLKNTSDAFTGKLEVTGSVDVDGEIWADQDVNLYWSSDLVFKKSKSTEELDVRIEASFNSVLNYNGTVSTVSTIDTGDGFNTLHIDYKLYSGSNFRAGQIMGVSNGTEYTFTDNSTSDLGDTSPISFSGSMSGDNFSIKTVATTSVSSISKSWKAKYKITKM